MEQTGSVEMDSKIVEEFESRFVEEVTDMLFLTVESANGAVVLGNGVLRPSLEIVATVDLTTGAFSKEKGRLEWLIPDIKGRTGWGYDFRQFNIYHIKGRKNIPIVLQEYQLKTLNNCYMVCDLIEDGATDPRLEKLKAKYLKPVYIDDSEIGQLELNREYSVFEGNIDWLGNECSVNLETDRDGGKTAKKVFAHLKEIYSDIAGWDKKFREYAVTQLIDTIGEWTDDDKEITDKELYDMLHITELVVSPSGEITAYYSENEDLFGGHAIEITADIDGTVESAYLVG